jgi:hypothetical protein
VVVFPGENPVEKTLGGEGCYSRLETGFYKFVSKPEGSRMWQECSDFSLSD